MEILLKAAPWKVYKTLFYTLLPEKNPFFDQNPQLIKQFTWEGVRICHFHRKLCVVIKI
jgi:hypothetical protein